MDLLNCCHSCVSGYKKFVKLLKRWSQISKVGSSILQEILSAVACLQAPIEDNVDVIVHPSIVMTTNFSDDAAILGNDPFQRLETLEELFRDAIEQMLGVIEYMEGDCACAGDIKLLQSAHTLLDMFQNDYDMKELVFKSIDTSVPAEVMKTYILAWKAEPFIYDLELQQSKEVSFYIMPTII
jgi:hypothetical protein